MTEPPPGTNTPRLQPLAPDIDQVPVQALATHHVVAVAFPQADHLAPGRVADVNGREKVREKDLDFFAEIDKFGNKEVKYLRKYGIASPF